MNEHNAHCERCSKCHAEIKAPEVFILVNSKTSEIFCKNCTDISTKIFKKRDQILLKQAKVKHGQRLTW